MSNWKRLIKVCCACVLCLPVMLTATSAYAAPARQAPDPSVLDKIAPWVLEYTASGKSEFLVVLKDQADLSSAHALPTKVEKGRYVYKTLWDKAQSAQKPILSWLEENEVEYRPYYIVNLIWVNGNRDVALALAARPDVARIEANPKISRPSTLLFAPQDLPAAGGTEANVTAVRAPQVWAMGFTGQGVIVGIQDSGCDWEHPALQPQYRGWDGTTANHDYNWHDAIHTDDPRTPPGNPCGCDSPFPCDDLGHGTHSLGIILGSDGGANQIGVAPGATWIGCRSIEQGWGKLSTYLECFEFFLAPYPVGADPSQGDSDKAPDVTNNSWTCPLLGNCLWDVLQAAVEAQRAAGIMTIAAAGNGEGANCFSISSPLAIYAAVYTVGALDGSTGAIASFSARGPAARTGLCKPNITAPGTAIRSSLPGGKYGSMHGTSAASPHVAGAVALLWSAYPALKGHIALTEQILNESAHPILDTDCGDSDWPNNVYGYGQLDIKQAVDLVGMIVTEGITPTVQDGMPGRFNELTRLITVPVELASSQGDLGTRHASKTNSSTGNALPAEIIVVWGVLSLLALGVASMAIGRTRLAHRV